MSEFEVAIKIAGKLDKSLQTSVSSAQKMLGSLGKGGLSSALTGIGNVMESTGKALTTGVTMPVIALGATSVKEFGSVDKSMKLVQATMGSTDAQAKQLESTMKKAAANSVFGMQDAADATLNFARQGFNAKQAGDMNGDGFISRNRRPRKRPEDVRQGLKLRSDSSRHPIDSPGAGQHDCHGFIRRHGNSRTDLQLSRMVNVRSGRNY